MSVTEIEGCYGDISDEQRFAAIFGAWEAAHAETLVSSLAELPTSMGPDVAV